MKKVTNNGNVGVTIVGADGEARTVRAGETKSVSYDAKHPANEALERQRAITLGGEGSTRGHLAQGRSEAPAGQQGRGQDSEHDSCNGACIVLTPPSRRRPRPAQRGRIH